MPVADYRRDFMRRVAEVTEAEAVAAMAKYLTPVFDRRRSCFAIASPISETAAIARAMGQKGFLATVFGAGDGEEKVLVVKEKDLDSLFRLYEEGEDEAWPLTPQPLWRTHKRLTALSIVAVAAATAALAVKVTRGALAKK